MKIGRIAAGVCALGLTTTLALSSMPAVEAATAAPKNVIVLIGDGMGYSHITNATYYEHGTAYKRIAGSPGKVNEVVGRAGFNFERFPVQTDMTTYSVYGSYDPQKAWTDFDYVKANPTDSAAASTAMATGVKTYNAGLGVDKDQNPVENISERAIAMGKAAGSISSVQFSHATPAGYVVHHPNRNDYRGIANQEIYSDMTVVMGAGHPEFTDGGAKKAPSYSYISGEDFNGLREGVEGWTLVEEKSDFEALTSGETPERVFGIAQAASTLQQGRPGKSVQPFDVPFNANVPSLETMTKGALNVLDNDPDGFTLMVEGGAIDWTGHANDSARNVEETLEFNKAVDAVIDWVETNSNWDETLVIVTADHETGYLEGPTSSDKFWSIQTGRKGRVVPTGHAWYSGDHTNQLVPVYAKGAGSQQLLARATKTDPVRGAYLDNTDLANLLLEDLWS